MMCPKKRMDEIYSPGKTEKKMLRPNAWVEEGTPYRRSKGSPTKGATKQEKHKQSK